MVQVRPSLFTFFKYQLVLAKAGRLPDAETHAERAAEMAREKGAGARLLLGKIQQAEGKITEAQNTWKELAEKFPGDPSAADFVVRSAGRRTLGPS